MLTTCKYFDIVGNRCSRVTDGKCDDLSDCEFKYIEELKAEIETLKKVKDFACINLKNYIADNNKLKAENATYKANADAVQKYIAQNEQLKTHIDGLGKKNAALKAENERLKEENWNFEEVVKLCRCEQYQQTLQEIKAIAEFHITQADSEDVQEDMKQIIDLITKAEEV